MNSVVKIDINKIRKDFPILARKVNNKPLVYFDSGATAQKPQQVINAIVNYYSNTNANIHRGVHALSQEASAAYENARITVQKHLNAISENEIIFTSGTTESVNLVASSFKHFIKADDEIIISAMEHHSNILPWQVLCQDKGATLKVIPLNERGELIIDEYKKLISPKTKLVAIAHVSNTMGTINPVKEIISIAHKKNIPVFVDGAQAIPHMIVDVQELDCDFYCFSGHKVYGPTGIGVLYGKQEWLNKLGNYQTGGGTIKTVSFSATEYTDGPARFEAGTPHIAGAIGLAVAIDYVNNIGLDHIAAHEHELLEYATEKLKQIAGLKIIGEAKQKAGVISFVVDGLHPYDIGMLLDAQGLAVRTGHHCTQPLMDFYKINGTVRVSFGIYNTFEEIDSLIVALNKSIQRLK